MFSDIFEKERVGTVHIDGVLLRTGPITDGLVAALNARYPAASLRIVSHPVSEVSVPPETEPTIQKPTLRVVK
jgi:hypothetical protein